MKTLALPISFAVAACAAIVPGILTAWHWHPYAYAAMGLAVLYLASRVLGGYPLFGRIAAEVPAYRGSAYTPGAEDMGALDDAGITLEQAYLQSMTGGYDTRGRPVDAAALAKLAEEEDRH